MSIVWGTLFRRLYCILFHFFSAFRSAAASIRSPLTATVHVSLLSEEPFGVRSGQPPGGAGGIGAFQCNQTGRATCVSECCRISLRPALVQWAGRGERIGSMCRRRLSPCAAARLDLWSRAAVPEAKASQNGSTWREGPARTALSKRTQRETNISWAVNMKQRCNVKVKLMKDRQW